MSEQPPPPPMNPTQCDMVWHDGAWRVWCEAILAGPCRGCPDAEVYASREVES